jgi:formate hydrogenlyase subunit 6/NADH:ubiquinone oxidoreductase subunit I
LLKSKDVEKFKYDKTVYIAAVGNCGACYYCVNACAENAIKEWNPPHYQPCSMYKVYEMCGSMSTKCTTHNTLGIKWAETHVLTIT